MKAALEARGISFVSANGSDALGITYIPEKLDNPA